MGGVKSGRSVPAVVLAILTASGMSLAHQPRLVGDRPSIEVRDPEVSQAFYARLAGEPQTYRIPSEVPFRLYVNLLVPDLPGIETDYVAVVFREGDGGGGPLARLDGTAAVWRPFFEPFGGDRYRVGPELDRIVPAGIYTVVVRSADNIGKYVLAVGRTERFPPREMARTIAALPKLKTYFGRSPWTAFFNLSGAFLLGFGIVFFAGPAAIVLAVRRRRRRRLARHGEDGHITGKR